MAYPLTEAQADYPPWDGPPRRALIICTQQRSGSTLLGEAIHSAGGLGCPLEYFHLGFRPAFEARWGTSGLRDYLDSLYRLRTDPSGVLSVKLFWRDLRALADEIKPGVSRGLRGQPTAEGRMETYRRLFAVVEDILPNPVWVHLARRDSLRQAVSNFVAWRTDRWRKLRPDEPAPAAVATYDSVHIRRFLARVLRHDAHWAGFFEANGLQATPVVYEDLERDYSGTLRRLLDDLDRPDAVVAPARLNKQADQGTEALLRQFAAELAREV